MLKPRRLLMLALPALLAGCGGMIINPYYYSAFDPHEAYSVAVVVSGTPSPGSVANVPEAVVAAMRGNTAFPTSFALLPPGASAPYRAIMMFNAPTYASSPLLCEEPLRVQAVPVAAGGPPRLPYSAVLCRGDRVLSAAYGYMDSVPIEDPRFYQSVAQITRTLFPPRNNQWELFGNGFNH